MKAFGMLMLMNDLSATDISSSSKESSYNDDETDLQDCLNLKLLSAKWLERGKFNIKMRGNRISIKTWILQ